jgi:hypothetical protein
VAVLVGWPEPAHEEDGRTRPPGEDLPRETGSIDRSHSEISHDGVGRTAQGVQPGECLGGAAGPMDHSACVEQSAPHQAQHDRLVVYDEGNGRRHRTSGSHGRTPVRGQVQSRPWDGTGKYGFANSSSRWAAQQLLSLVDEKCDESPHHRISRDFPSAA